jgi:tetratricopeptide (TPR) repeat protein
MKQTTCVCVAVIAFCAATACITTKQGYVSKGNKLYDSGKYAEASLNYQKAIQKDPKFGEAYYRLGLAAIKQNEAREAYDSLYRAAQLLPNRTDVINKFADVSLAFYLASPSHPQFLYKQITQLSDELLSKEPNSYEGLMLKGYLAETDRKPKEAIESFRKALQVDSSNAGVTTQLVGLLIQDGQAQEGEKLAQDLIGRDKTYGPVYDLLYSLYSNTGRAAAAENILKAKVRNNPKDAGYIVQLARHYYRLNETAEMNAALQQLVSNPQDFPQGRLWVGDYYQGLKNYAEALRYYQDGARTAHDEKDGRIYHMRTAMSLVALGKNAEALPVVLAVLKAHPDDEEALRLHADLLLNAGKVQDADTAAKEFQILSDKHPNDAALRLQLGRAYRLKGDLPTARGQFQAALSKGPDLVDARYELADIDLKQAQPEEALLQSNEILKRRPRDPRARLLNARALSDSGNFKQASAELTRLMQDNPRDSEAQFQLGVLAIMEGKPKDAIPILSKFQGDPRAVAGLATAYTYERQLDKAKEVVYAGLKKWPDSPILIEKSASLQAVSGNYDGAITQFQQLLDKEPKSVDLRRRMGDVYTLKGDQDKAIAFYQQANELAPGDLNIALTLADALARAGRNAEAKKRYEGIVKLHPENFTALNNLAYLLADTGGDLDEALRLAQQALAKAPNQAAFMDTVGYIYLKKGLGDSAVQTFTSLVRKNPHVPAYRYHLGMALLAKGDKLAAKKALQAALDDRPSPQDKRKIVELLGRIS